MRHRVHAGYTLLLPLRQGSEAAARAWLAGAKLPFDRSASTHFATITVLDADEYRGEPLPSTLLFATSFCGLVTDHVAELVELMSAELCELFAHCEGFQGDLAVFITANRHPDCFYSGMQNVSPAQIQQEAQLRDAIENWLGVGNVTGTAVELREQIVAFVRSRDDLRWALEPVTVPKGTWRAQHAQSLVLGAGLATAFVLTALGLWLAPMLTLVAWIAVVVFVLLLVIDIRLGEEEQSYVSSRLADAKARELAETQNRPVINEFVIAGRIKEEGLSRPIVLRGALWVIECLVQGVGITSPLGIPTVATARWIAADRGRRLVFISNYTNAAEAYVRDFIDPPTGARNINLTFGFGRGYPKTRWIIKDGAGTNPDGFSNVVVEHQRAAAYWYRGPAANLSVDNIRTNQQIRTGLVGDCTPDEAKAWLQLF